jgi:hypothetical protein
MNFAKLIKTSRLTERNNRPHTNKLIQPVNLFANNNTIFIIQNHTTRLKSVVFI